MVEAISDGTFDGPSVVQLWDVKSTPPTQKAEIRNGARILDADITPDVRLALLERKRFAVTSWQPESLRREFCARLLPNESEKKEYNQLCSGPSESRAW
jgi:hypothetical protein